MIPIGKGSLDELEAYVKSETARWGKVIRERRPRRIAISRWNAQGVRRWNGRVRWLLAALSLAVVSRLGAHAQDYPTRPLTFVVPFTPGGATDFLARMLGQGARGAARQAGGGREPPGRRHHHRLELGRQGRARRPHAADGDVDADGDQRLAATSSLPFDPATDFVPLAMVAQSPFVLIVNPSLPVKIGAGAHRLRQGQARASCRSAPAGRARRIISSPSCSRA